MGITAPLTLGEITEIYNVKVKEMGSYLEIYYYEKNISRMKPGFELRDKDLFDNGHSYDSREISNNEIRSDSLYRTRVRLVELVKTNEKYFNSFLTLTFRDELSYEDAGECFANWVRQVRKYDHDFKYLAVVEYHTNREVIHFHLMSSLIPGSELLPKRKTKRLWNPNIKASVSFDYYDIPYWSYGYSQAYDLSVTDDNFSPSLYMTKYLFKDADKRFFGRNKLRASQNLEKPKEKVYEADSDDFEDLLVSLHKKYDLNGSKRVTPKRLNGFGFVVQSYTVK